jgi:hypothetical protein
MANPTIWGSFWWPGGRDGMPVGITFLFRSNPISCAFMDSSLSRSMSDFKLM